MAALVRQVPREQRQILALLVLLVPLVPQRLALLDPPVAAQPVQLDSEAPQETLEQRDVKATLVPPVFVVPLVQKDSQEE